MENEIKVGEYVRLENGDIFKIDEDTTNYYNSNKDFITNEIVKHSSNLIDIIEEGDYVNNCRVVEHAYQKRRLFVTYLYIGGKVITTTEDYSWELTKDREDWVKSIVTKEQFENISYKVVD